MAQLNGLRNPAIGLGPQFVGGPTNKANSARSERRAMIALVAVFALLVQALIPSLVMAAPGAPGDLLICTQMGLQTAPGDGGAPAPANHACKHCLCPAPATDPPQAVTIQHVAYVVAVARTVLPSHRRIPPARARPRPYGQGPPVSDL